MLVLDACALLALIKDEPGADVVSRAAAHNDATISSVNYAEVLQKAASLGVTAEEVDAALEDLGITVTPFARLDARLTASFYSHQPEAGRLTPADKGRYLPLASLRPDPLATSVSSGAAPGRVPLSVGSSPHRVGQR